VSGEHPATGDTCSEKPSDRHGARKRTLCLLASCCEHLDVSGAGGVGRCGDMYLSLVAATREEPLTTGRGGCVADPLKLASLC